MVGCSFDSGGVGRVRQPHPIWLVVLSAIAFLAADLALPLFFQLGPLGRGKPLAGADLLFAQFAAGIEHAAFALCIMAGLTIGRKDLLAGGSIAC